jgi:REP element-mobilizing transposase RayT
MGYNNNIMPTRKIPFVPGEYYHIYNRGNSKQQIFFDEEDYKRFIKCLYICNSKKSFKFREDIVKAKIDSFEFDRGELIVSIGAWVLMPNHFHLYLTISPHVGHGENSKEKNAITEFMRKLSTSYVKYINEKYNRTGGLFEGVFKARHISDDNYAKYIFSYIHLNPVKLIQPKWKEEGIKNIKKTLDFLKYYKWSSYIDYKEKHRPESKIIASNDFPMDFKNIKDFDREIIDWLEYGSED